MSGDPAPLRLMRNRHLLIMTIAAILVGGVTAISSLPTIEDPRLTPRNAVIITALPGASAERVEALITENIERELLEIPEVNEIDSTSRSGISSIVIGLHDHVTNTEEALAEIRDKLADVANTFPPEASPPFFDDKRSAVAFSHIVAMTADGDEDTAMVTLSRLGRDLADRFRQIPGTEIVRVYGAPNEEITATVEHDELVALGLTVDQVARAIVGADAKVQSGTLRANDSNVLLEVSGKLDSVERVAEVPITSSADGSVQRLGDIATLEKNWRNPPQDLALVNGRRAVYVAARMDGRQRSNAWATKSRAVVEEFRSEVGGRVRVDDVFDQTIYTSERLSSLANNLMAGALVIFFVVIFTMGLRSAVVVGSALPLAAALTLFALTLTGGTLQQMSIFGMIIALGLLIDNAIVVVDEVRRQLNAGATRSDAVTHTIHHLFAPLLASTLTTVLAFAPIPLLQGNMGDFVGPIGTSVVLALLASFCLAMTLIPALAGLYVRPSTDKDRSWWKTGVRGEFIAIRYRRALTYGLARPWLLIAIGAAVPFIGFLVSPYLDNQFFPRVDRNMFDIQVWLPNESSIAKTRATVTDIESRIREEPTVTEVSWLVGGSYPTIYYNLLMTTDNAPHYARGVIVTENSEQVKPLIRRLQHNLDQGYPDAQVVVRQFSQGPPVGAEIEFKIFGPSIPVLQNLGERVREELYSSPDVLHTQATMARGEPKLWFAVDEVEARGLGLGLRDVASQLETALEGRVSGSVIEQLEEMPVRVRVSDERRASLDQLSSLSLVSPRSGERVPLTTLGELELKPEGAAITRCDTKRCNRILAYTRNEALPIEIANEIKKRLDDSGFTVPAGYSLELGGESEDQATAIGNLLTHAPVLLVLMITTIVLSFRSFQLAVLLVSVAVMSMGLSFLATFFSGFPFSFQSILGTAGLIGIALNDSIVVLAAFEAHPSAKHGDIQGMVDAVSATGRHVISTSLTTMGGFLPLLLFIGGDFWPPLAVVLAGGVGGATILALIFIPGAYAILSRNAEPETQSNHEDASATERAALTTS